MKLQTKILLWVIGAIGTALAFSLIVLALAPLFINSATMKGKIRALVSQQIGGDVTFQRLDLSLLPYPSVIIYHPSFSIPAMVDGTLEDIRVYPQLFPLLEGKVLISKVQIREPDVRVILSDSTGKEKPGAFSLANVKTTIQSALTSLQTIAPDLKFQIDKGTLVFSKKNSPVLSLKNVNARLTASPRKIDISVEAHLASWGDASLSTKISYDDDKVEVKDLSGKLGHSFLSDFSARIALAETPFIEVLSGRAAISLDELYRSLSLTKSQGPFLKDIRSMKGIVSFSSINFAGPITQPTQGRMQINGHAENVVVDSILLPVPLTVNGNFSLDRDGIDVDNLIASAGKSSASGVSARFAWRKNQRIEVNSGRAVIDLDQVYQWRSLFSGLGDLLKDVTDLKGTVKLSSMNLAGPLSRPDTWKMNITGRAENIVIHSPLLPAPLSATGRFTAGRENVEVTGLSASLGESSIYEVSARLAWKARSPLEIRSGKARISLGEVYQWRSRFSGLKDVLKDVRALSGTVKLSSMHVAGSFSPDGTWQITTAGSVENILFDSSLLPGPIAMSRGIFNLSPEKLTFNDSHAAFLDTSIIMSGSLNGPPGSIDAADLSLGGTVGQESMQWAFKKFSLPSKLIVNAPVLLSEIHLIWQKSAGISLAGTLAVSDGPAISLDLYRSPEELIVRRATIKDRDTDATLRLRRQNTATDLSFSGTLAESTLSRIFMNLTLGQGKIEGKLQVNILAGQPMNFTAEGAIEGNDFVIPSVLTIPLRVDRFMMHAIRNTLTVDSASMTWGGSHVMLKGVASASAEGFILDMDLDSDGININEIEHATAIPPGRKGEEKIEETTAIPPGKKSEEKKEERAGKPNIYGIIRFNSASVTYGRYTVSPVKAIITRTRDGLNAAITEAKVCGLSVPGTFATSHGDMQLIFKPTAEQQQLGPAIACLSGGDVNMTGTFNLNTEIKISGKRETLLTDLEGGIDFKAKDGKIYRYPELAKIFSLLSVTEIFRGKQPELGGNGFPYRSMALKGKLHQGKLMVEQAYIGGSSLNIIGEGNVDIAGKKMDLVVLVSPFSTIDWIIGHIPIVRTVLGGTLISIPVKVSGDLSNPDATFLNPSAVGSRTLDLMKNIVGLPIEIISPITPHEK